MAQLGKSNDADEYAILVCLGEPRDDAGVGTRLRPLGNDIGVEQKTHRSMGRGRSLLRLAFKPEPRSGEAAKNSARLPVRFALRSHSSAATTTTAFRPLRVIVCGPRDCACSMTSLSFALASATVHVVAVIAEVPRRSHSLDGHDSHGRI